jgi:Circularly permutated YpsA SLOG family
MRRLVPERAESRGRSDCQKVSTDRDAVSELRAADRVERSGHRRNGYFLARPGSARWLKETAEFAVKQDKPCLHAHSGQEDVAQALRDFVADNEIKTLNVAGPRASKEPGVAKFVKELLEKAFSE